MVLLLPYGHYSNNLVQNNQTMLYTKYLSSWPYGLKELFFSPVLNNWYAGWGHFWPQGHDLNKSGTNYKTVLNTYTLGLTVLEKILFKNPYIN